MSIRKLLVCSNLAVAALCLPAVRVQAQTTAKPAAKPAVRTPVVNANADLMKLAKAGMSDEILLATVAEAKTARRRYDTSADALVALKNAGVSQRVISAILGINAPTSANTGESVPRTSTTIQPPSATPLTQHVGISFDQPSTQSLEGRDAGIYLVNGSDQEQLEPAVYSGGKTGGKFLSSITGLAKSSLKAVVRSSRANQRLQSSTPTFYFYFENRGAGLSNTGGTFTGFMNSASSPNEFVLVRMKVSTDEREIVIGESWMFSDRSGVRSKDTVDLIVKKVKAGVYEVRPRTPLTAGEYCFFYAAGAAEKGGVGKLFDFGVDPGAGTQ